MTANRAFIQQLKTIVGHHQVLTSESDKNYYCKGYRAGHGPALAVVIPDSLWQLWQITEVCVKNDKIILMQAANTGLTGGSTPHGDDYDRDIVIISTRKLSGLQIIDDAKQVLAFPGSSLTELEDALKPYHKEPHSVIGSSCIGASVVGGICNNSGGSLIRRGPAFTEKSLFAQINKDGSLSLVNHLGINLGDTPETMLNNLEKGHFTIGDAADWEGRIWAEEYAEVVKDVNADTPARFNGNPQYLLDSAGSAGKVVVFAVRLATFDKADKTETYYIGTNDEAELVALRRLLLSEMSQLPLQAEYIHTEAFRLTRKYSKHTILAIRKLGSPAIPKLMANKAKWDQRMKALKIVPSNTVDRVLQLANRILPDVVSKNLLQYHQQYEHHLMIKIEAHQSKEMQQHLMTFFKTVSGRYFKCSAEEEAEAFLFRFAVANCTIDYCNYYNILVEERLVAFDVALRRNDEQWRFKLPPHLQAQVQEDACCGHFFCFVAHQDYVLKAGVDAHQFKEDVLAYLNQRGAKYPAEHNIGHLYQASETYEKHFRYLDPSNSCNPGVGLTSKRKYWQ